MDIMQKVFAIIGLLCSAVPVCYANESPQVWVNAVDEMVSLDCMNNVAVVAYSTNGV